MSKSKIAALAQPSAARPRAPKNIAVPRDQIADFCRRWHIQEFAFFGSVLRDDFRPDSDIDVLVTFGDDARWSLFDIVDMHDELEKIFGRKVDLVEPDTIINPFRRRTILSDPEIIYAV